MIRSLTIKFLLLAGTLGLVMALNWSVVDPSAETSRMASLQSVPVSLEKASRFTAPGGKVEPSIKVSAASKLGDFNVSDPKDLNLITAQELETLPGIGPTLAKRIVNHRMQVGVFQSIQALTQVKGIGKKKLQALIPLLKISPNLVARKSQE